VTFLENHDTGSTLQHWPFPTDGLGQGYVQNPKPYTLHPTPYTLHPTP